MRVTRWRAAGLGLAGVAALGLFALLFWRGGEWLLADAVYQNPAFAIQRVDVRTDGVIAPAVIRRWAMVQPGQNLLALDLMRVKRDLEMYSPIAGRLRRAGAAGHAADHCVRAPAHRPGHQPANRVPAAASTP